MTAIQFIPLVCAAAIYFFRLREIGARRDTVPGKITANYTFRLFMIVGTLVLIFSVAEYFWRGAVFHWGWLLAGLACAIFSFWLRLKAIAALGRFWSLHVEIRENHEFVKSGPFRWMRHPTYFSMILELVATALILNAFYTLLIVPVLFVPALLLRLRVEERALVEKFGDAYRQYQGEVPALFPIRWPKAK